ncbi:MAG: amidohydrolase [Actinobacteria bacterium]|nr:amidohydrolase [Actinomycetota bacterium]
MTERLVIQGGTLLPMGENPEVIPEATVVAEDGLIVEAAGPKRYRPDRDTEVIDAGGRLVIPGLVNAHTHLYQVLLRGMWDDLPLMPWLRRIYQVGEVLEPEDCYVGALLGSLESLESGVTTVCDHFFLNPSPDHAAATIAGMRKAGVRAVLARAIMDSGELPPSCVKEEPEAALGLVSELLGRYEADLSGGMLTLMVGPNTPPINASSELIRRVGGFARQKGLRVSAHVAEGRDIVRQCREKHGGEVVDYLDSQGLVESNATFAHCVHLSQEEIGILAARGASVVHNPVSNCMLGDGVAPVPELLAAGVNVALGTDGAASNHTQDMFEVMKLTSLLQRVTNGRPDVMSPYQVLRMATAGGARALGLEGLVGTIEKGKRADIAIVDPFRAPHGAAMHNVFTHLVHTLKAGDVETTIVDGRVLLRRHALVRQDVGTIIAEAGRRAQDLRGRAESPSSEGGSS